MSASPPFLQRLCEIRAALEAAASDGAQYCEAREATVEALQQRVASLSAACEAHGAEVAALRADAATLREERGASGASQRALAGAAEAAAAEMESELWGVAALLEEKERCVWGQC